MDSNNPAVAAGKTSKHYIIACSGFLLSSLLAITVQIFLFSPISPEPLELPPASTASLLPQNNQLQEVIKLGEGILKDPEDVCVDKRTGVLYTATRDGWIKRLHRNGSWENWRMIGGNSLLGVALDPAGDLIVCDADQGLLRVGEDGVTVVASHVNGARIRFADEVIAASDGSLYFSDASTKFGSHNGFLDLLEAKPHGRLLKYDPLLNETSILLNDLYFANGVALSTDEDYLVVCETWKYRCLKYWLKGENRGQTEVFIDNLPGAPDNINLAPDGSFWIALLQLTRCGMEFVHTSKAAKHFLATFTGLIKPVIALHKSAMVANVATDGKIVKVLRDPTGKVMSFVTSAVEFEDHLYLGNRNSNFIGKFPLKTALDCALHKL